MFYDLYIISRTHLYYSFLGHQRQQQQRVRFACLRYRRCSLPIHTLIVDIHRIYAVTLKHFHSVILHYCVQNQRAALVEATFLG